MTDDWEETETERIEVKRGYLSSMRMTRSMFAELNECSLISAWRVLRKHCLYDILGPDYCPVPFIETSQYFDMNNVYALNENNTVMVKLRRLFGGRRRQFRYVAKLRDILKFRSERDKQIIRRKSRLHNIDKQWDRELTMDLQMTRDSVKKHLFLNVATIKVVGSNLDWEVGDDHCPDVFVDRRRVVDSSNVTKIIIINRVVVAFGLTIRYCCGTSDDGIKEWGSVGPIPIAFQATKFKVKRNDQLVRTRLVTADELFHHKNWEVPDGHPFKCVVLDAYLHDGKHENIAVK